MSLTDNLTSDFEGLDRINKRAPQLTFMRRTPMLTHTIGPSPSAVISVLPVLSHLTCILSREVKAVEKEF